MVNKALGKPVLQKEDLIKLMLYYGASRGAKTEEYGRAFVVVQPAEKTERTAIVSSLLRPGEAELQASGCDLTGP